jgi:hypothetical protein
VLTSGPVHEAFAQPVSATAGAGPLAPQEPPALLAEEPPDQRPAGDDVQWIPGYWSWDGDRTDWTWVSGTWRVAPPQRKWVPGHWSQINNGWQWAPGFWAADTLEQVQYLDAPPATLDDGPSTPAPDANSFFVPGAWMFRTSRYVWRPGYWCAERPGFIWNPCRYTWTPAGTVFCDGYWDYALENRGCLFAPICFSRPVWRTPGWCWRPSYCVNPVGLLASLFVWPSHSHYYFGDYYGSRYAGLGVRPWFAYGYGAGYHADPLYSYYRWSHRNDTGWYAGLRGDYLGRVNGTLARPARTLIEQNTLVQRNAANNVNALRVVQPLTQMARNSNLSLARVAPSQAAELRNVQSHYQQLSQARQSFERPGRPANEPRVLSLTAGPAAPRGEPSHRPTSASQAPSQVHVNRGEPAARPGPAQAPVGASPVHTPAHAPAVTSAGGPAMLRPTAPSSGATRPVDPQRPTVSASHTPQYPYKSAHPASPSARPTESVPPRSQPSSRPTASYGRPATYRPMTATETPRYQPRPAAPRSAQPSAAPARTPAPARPAPASAPSHPAPAPARPAPAPAHAAPARPAPAPSSATPGRPATSKEHAPKH